MALTIERVHSFLRDKSELQEWVTIACQRGNVYIDMLDALPVVSKPKDKPETIRFITTLSICLLRDNETLEMALLTKKNELVYLPGEKYMPTKQFDSLEELYPEVLKLVSRP